MELLFLLRAANLERRKRSKHSEWSHRRIETGLLHQAATEACQSQEENQVEVRSGT